ncbi:hypothetical protein ACLB2K_040556 [Fragaria x ananassa]
MFSSSGTMPPRRRPRVASSTNANEGGEVRGLADSIWAMLRGVLDRVQPPRSVKKRDVADVVADALSRNPSISLFHLRMVRVTLLCELRAIRVDLAVDEVGALVASFHVRPVLVDKVREAQYNDPSIVRLMEKAANGVAKNFSVRRDGSLLFKSRLCVPKRNEELKFELMEEAHSSAYAAHPGSTKMYQTLKDYYWWPNMKREIVAFVSRCLICQQVKAERQKPLGLLEPLPNPVWKLDHITIDFVFSLPRTREGHDDIWVIVDRLTKYAHFLPVRKKFSLDKLAELYANEKIKVVRDRLKAAQSRQKSYADVRRKDLEFQVGDWVYHPVNPALHQLGQLILLRHCTKLVVSNDRATQNKETQGTSTQYLFSGNSQEPGKDVRATPAIAPNKKTLALGLTC